MEQMDKITHVPLEKIRPSRTNPRKLFDGQEELMESIARNGIMQPITAVYVDGERRYRAAKQLGLADMPCILVDMSDDEVREAQLISHVQRTNIHPMEEAEAYARELPVEGSFEEWNERLGHLASKVGKPAAHVSQRVALNALIAIVRSAFWKNLITLEHAQLIAKMQPDDQLKALEYVLESYFGGNDEIDEEAEFDIVKSIANLKEWIEREISLNLSKAPFDKGNADLVPGVPACLLCPKNSGYNKALFPDLQKHDVCGDRACFKAKMEAHMAQQKKAVRKAEKRGFIMISTTRLSMDDPLKVKDVKMGGSYKIVKKGAECEDMKVAQWVDGPNLGKTTLACNYSKCAKHWGGEGRSAASSSKAPGKFDSPKEVAKREKANREARLTKAINAERKVRAAKLVMEKSAGKPGSFGWRMFSLIELNGGNLDDSLFEAIYGRPGHEISDKDVRAMSEKEVERLAMALLVSQYYTDTTEELIEHFKIDESKIKVQIAKELHHCESCECTELTACGDEENRCSWNKPFQSAGRWVCTQCVDKVKPVEAPKPATKKTGKKKAA